MGTATPQAHIQSVSEQVSVAAQLSPNQFEQLPQQNFQTVLNLRSYQEEGASQRDRQRAESLGLTYANLPIESTELRRAKINEVIQKICALPKPLLIYCRSARRATFIALLYLAEEEGVTLEESRQRGRSLGFDFENRPNFNQHMERYIRNIAR